MNKRLLFPLLALILALALAAPHAPARAQDGTNPMCNGLSEDDCQIILDAQEQMGTVRLVSMPSWSVNLDMTAEDETMAFAASGAITVVPPQGLVALLSDLGGQPEAMMDFVNQIDSAMIEQWLSEMALDFALTNISYAGEGDDAAYSGELIIKDSTIYIQIPSPTGAVTWFGQVIEPADLSELDSSLDDLRETLNDPEALAQIPAMMELGVETSAFSELANRYVSTTRGADEDGLMVFTTSFDLAGYLGDPELGTLIVELLKSPAMAELTEEADLQVTPAQVQLMMDAIKLMLVESTFDSTQWISADDGYIHRVEVNFAVNLDVSQLSGEAVEPVELSLQAAVELADFNDVSPDAITVPDSYLPMDDMENYYPGTPSMIAAQLEPGQTFSSTLASEDSDDIYGIALEAGSTITIEVTPIRGADILVVGPDGFEVATGVSGEPLEFTAETAGQHLITVTNSWGDYSLTIRPQ